MLVRLTGPREGQTVRLNGVQFVKGRARIHPGQLLYFSRCYAVTPTEDVDGIRNDAPEAPERAREEAPSGADLPQEPSGAPEAPADDGGGDDQPEARPEGSVPDGDGHEDSREHGPADNDPLGEALKQLDPSDNTHWTNDGRPRVKALSDVLGRRVTKDEILSRFEEGERSRV